MKRGGPKRDPRLSAWEQKQRALRRAAERKRFHDTTVKAKCAMCLLRPVGGLARATYYPMLARIEAHHILPKAKMRAQGWGEGTDDLRNGMALCSYHHGRHEKYVERVPRALLPTGVFELAEELGLSWMLDAEYPL